MQEPGPQVVAVVAIVTTFLFSLAEAALTHYSPPRLLDLAKKGGKDAPISGFIQSDAQTLLTCQAVAMSGMIAFALALLAWMDGDTGQFGVWELVRSGGVALLILLTVGRILPLFIGRIYAERILLSVRPVLLVAKTITSPLIWLIELLRRVTERFAGRPVEAEGAGHIHEEILSAVGEGEMEGVLNEDEADMIERALSLRDTDVADVMQPRTDMYGIEVETPIAEAVAEISRVGHSRIPVYRENMDQIEGILYAKDLLEHWGDPDANKILLADLARKPLFVPETKAASQLLEEFKRTKLHMAIVLDEYGGTAGLITIEDILEKLVGSIEDEYDESEAEPQLDLLSDGEADVDARVHVDDLADAFDIELPESEVDSVGGLVFNVLGRIPDPGDEFEYGGLHFTVLDANERRVNRVKVVRNSP